MLYFFIFAMTVSTFALQDNDASKKSFAEMLCAQYQILYVGTEDDMFRMRESTMILYVLETNILIIVCLNILISVVTDNYDMVMQKMEATDCHFRANLMDEIESLLVWRRSYGYEQYIVYAYYADAYAAGGGDDEHGKFRMLKQQISSVHIDLKQKMERIHKTIKDNMKDRLDTIEAQNKEITDLNQKLL